jgi:tRNA modification GTPase
MVLENDTIVAIATASGVGAISIIRLSGTDAYKIALQITKKDNLNPRFAHLSKIYDKDENLIDESLVIYFQNPFSFTGEDVVEFQCHGGIALSEIILEACLSFGARIANPGEFSKRAYLNQKIDLSQAQAISKLIEAKSADSVKLLARQLKGELKDFVNEIRQDLLFILAYVEVSIDYAEEDLPDDILAQIHTKLETTNKKLTTTLESSLRRESMIEGFKVAIVGKPNVGKSSLLNKLLNFDRAIVSNIAGTTRDTIEENIKIGSHIIKVVDTAGIREADDEIEKIGIEKSKAAIDEADIVVALFDNSRFYDNEDKQIIHLINNTDKKVITVLNKCDLEVKFDKTYLSTIDVELSISKGLENNSISLLVKSLQTLLDDDSGLCEGMMLVSKSQVGSVQDTLYEIKTAQKLIDENQLEFFAHHVTNALELISQITRPYEHNQMLDVMFGEFCLGK